jgi:hypothetical protein
MRQIGKGIWMVRSHSVRPCCFSARRLKFGIHEDAWKYGTWNLVIVMYTAGTKGCTELEE